MSSDARSAPSSPAWLPGADLPGGEPSRGDRAPAPHHHTQWWRQDLGDRTRRCREGDDPTLPRPSARSSTCQGRGLDRGSWQPGPTRQDRPHSQGLRESSRLPWGGAARDGDLRQAACSPLQTPPLSRVPHRSSSNTTLVCDTLTFSSLLNAKKIIEVLFGHKTTQPRILLKRSS